MEKFEFIFTNVEQNMFCKEKPRDPKAFYGLDMRRVGSDSHENACMYYQKMKPLLAHFKAKRPKDLVGKTFQSTRSDATGAFELFLVEIKRGQPYVVPTDEELYGRAATALSRMECPDFNNEDPRTVSQAFSKIFRWDVDPKWLKQLKEKVALLSQGEVKIEEADANDFNCRIKGAAEYLALVSKTKRQLFILGPYSSPFEFNPGK